MSTEDVTFLGTVPELYDRYLGPAVFEPYAADLVSRIPVDPPATDLNQPMI